MELKDDEKTNSNLEKTEDSEEYSSEAEEEIEENENHADSTLIFEKIAIYETEERAVEYLKMLGFTFYQRRGNLKLYRCANLKYRVKPQCQLMYSIKFHENDQESGWVVSSTKKEHSCVIRDEKFKSLDQITEEAKEVIEMMISIGICTAKKVESRLLHLKNEGKYTGNIPTENQLRYAITKLKMEKFGPPTLSLGELEEWCYLHSKDGLDLKELDDTDPFVVAYKINYGVDDEEKSFWFQVSSKCLLQLAAEIDNLACDSTYKLALAGFPGVIVGTIDNKKRFHPLSLSIVSNEKEETYFEIFEVIICSPCTHLLTIDQTTQKKYDFLFFQQSLKDGTQLITHKEMKIKKFLSDAAKMIRNAAVRAFGADVTLVMCFAHVSTNIDKRMKAFVKNEDDFDDIKNDLRKLQLSHNENVFQKASKLFLRKWEPKYNQLTEYIETNWLKQNSNWYEGAAHLFPTTNNGNESTNRWLKENHFLRNRKSLAELKELSLSVIGYWSFVLTKRHSFAFEPEIKFQDWKKAVAWSSGSVKIFEDDKSKRTWMEQIPF